MFGRNLNRDLLKLAILTLITVMTWAGFDIYRAFHQVEIPQVLKRQIQPLNPQLDKKILEDLQEREFITREEARERLGRPAVILEEEILEEEIVEEATRSATLSAVIIR